MSQDVFESWNKLSQNAFDAAKKLADVNTNISEKLLREQIELANDLMSSATKTIESAGKAKGVQDILASQSAAAQECSQRVVKTCRSCADVAAEARQAYSELLEQGMQAASKNMNAAAASAGKKAA